MKKNFYMAAAVALAALSFPSCSDMEDDDIAPAAESGVEQVTLTATVAVKCGDSGLSKAALQSDGATIYFSPNEEVWTILYDEDGEEELYSGVFAGSNTSAAATTTFTGSVSKSVFDNSYYIMAYLPASAWDEEWAALTIPSEQTPVANGFDPAAFAASGYTTISDKSITFEPQVSLLKFTAVSDGDITVEGDGICGNYFDDEDKITVKGLVKGTTYYVCIRFSEWSDGHVDHNGGDYTDGIKFLDSNGNEIKTVTPSGLLQAGYYYTVDLSSSK